MLGEVIDTYKKGKIKIEVIDSYVHPDYIIYINGGTGEQGCLRDELTAKEVYERYINDLPY